MTWHPAPLCFTSYRLLETLILHTIYDHHTTVFYNYHLAKSWLWSMLVLDRRYNLGCEHPCVYSPLAQLQEAMPQSREDLPSKRSCLRCHEHKVRCDRGNPCGRCLQANARCSFPGNKRAPRKLNRPPIATILSQLKELEEEVERLRARPVVNQNESSSRQLDLSAGQNFHPNIQASDVEILTNRSVMRDGESFGDQVGQ